MVGFSVPRKNPISRLDSISAGTLAENVSGETRQARRGGVGGGRGVAVRPDAVSASVDRRGERRQLRLSERGAHDGGRQNIAPDTAFEHAASAIGIRVHLHAAGVRTLAPPSRPDGADVPARTAGAFRDRRQRRRLGTGATFQAAPCSPTTHPAPFFLAAAVPAARPTL